MNSEVLTPLLNWLDLAGVAIFALTGALVAAKERQTFVTLGFFLARHRGRRRDGA